MKRRMTMMIAVAVGAVGLMAAPASADHTSVRNPSGCHETNLNGGVPNANSGQDPAESGWHNSARGHARAATVSPVHSDGGC